MLCRWIVWSVFHNWYLFTFFFGSRRVLFALGTAAGCEPPRTLRLQRPKGAASTSQSRCWPGFWCSSYSHKRGQKKKKTLPDIPLPHGEWGGRGGEGREFMKGLYLGHSDTACSVGLSVKTKQNRKKKVLTNAVPSGEGRGICRLRGLNEGGLTRREVSVCVGMPVASLTQPSALCWKWLWHKPPKTVIKALAVVCTTPTNRLICGSRVGPAARRA